MNNHDNYENQINSYHQEVNMWEKKNQDILLKIENHVIFFITGDIRAKAE